MRLKFLIAINLAIKKLILVNLTINRIVKTRLYVSIIIQSTVHFTQKSQPNIRMQSQMLALWLLSLQAQPVIAHEFVDISWRERAAWVLLTISPDFKKYSSAVAPTIKNLSRLKKLIVINGLTR